MFIFDVTQGQLINLATTTRIHVKENKKVDMWQVLADLPGGEPGVLFEANDEWSARNFFNALQQDILKADLFFKRS